MPAKIFLILLGLVLIAGLVACKSKGMKMRESVDYLIENPDDEKTFNRLVAMANTGSEVQRASVLYELVRFANHTTATAEKVIPVIYQNLSDSNTVIRRRALESLSMLKPPYNSISAPRIVETMERFPDDNTFYPGLGNFRHMGPEGCQYYQMLLRILDNKRVSFEQKNDVLQLFLRAPSYCVEEAVECLEIASNHSSTRISKLAQEYLAEVKAELAESKAVTRDGSDNFAENARASD